MLYTLTLTLTPTPTPTLLQAVCDRGGREQLATLGTAAERGVLERAGCRLDGLREAAVRLQPLLHTVTASVTYGCRLDWLGEAAVRLQPLLHTVTASVTYGCRLDELAEAAEAAVLVEMAKERKKGGKKEKRATAGAAEAEAEAAAAKAVTAAAKVQVGEAAADEGGDTDEGSDADEGAPEAGAFSRGTRKQRKAKARSAAVRAAIGLDGVLSP